MTNSFTDLKMIKGLQKPPSKAENRSSKLTPSWLFLHFYCRRFFGKRPEAPCRRPWAPYVKSSAVKWPRHYSRYVGLWAKIGHAVIIQAWVLFTQSTVSPVAGSTKSAWRHSSCYHSVLAVSPMCHYPALACAKTVIWQAKTFPYVPC